MKQQLLTVCTGNICRSPMAQILLSQAFPEVWVRSAGTHALIGHPADQSAIALMADMGLNLSNHRAEQITSVMCQQATVILVMDEDNLRWIENLYPFARGRTFRLCQHRSMNVPDPYRLSMAQFRESLAMIEDGLQFWVDRIQRII